MLLCASAAVRADAPGEGSEVTGSVHRLLTLVCTLEMGLLSPPPPLPPLQFISLFIYTYMSIPVYLCVGACGSQKRASDPLGLKLQAAVSYLMWVLEQNPHPQEEQ